MVALLVAREGPAAGSVYELGEGATTLGRGDGNDIVLPYEGISWHHAEVRREGGGYIVADRGSKNGTWLNDRRLAVAVGEPMTEGDVLTLPCRPPLRLALALRAPTATVELALPGDERLPAPRAEQSDIAPLTPGADRDLVISLRTAEVWARGQPVTLTAKEFRVLAVLYEAGGALLSKHELAAQVWPEYEGAVGNENIEQLISRLRRKIEDDPERPRYLLTVRGLGYRLVV